MAAHRTSIVRAAIGCLFLSRVIVVLVLFVPCCVPSDANTAAAAPQQQQQQPPPPRSSSPRPSGATTPAPAAPPQQQPQPQKIVIGVDGGTESVRACCFDAASGRVVGRVCARSYATRHPQPGWAEQNPTDWWDCFGRAVRDAVASVVVEQNGNNNNNDDDNSNNNTAFEFCGLCLDTTCCSVVALDRDSMEPLRPCLLWMDQRAAAETETVLATRDVALQINCHGEGPVSAEWMIAKALWLRDHEYDATWRRCGTLCEYQDYLNYKLTDAVVASACNAATRWHWDGELAAAACQSDNNDDDGGGGSSSEQRRYPGRPLSLYQKLGIPELADKLPQTCLAMGQPIGNGLTASAARHLGLPENLPVLQGGPDAFVGLIGLGCCCGGSGDEDDGDGDEQHEQPSSSARCCLITGSSHLHCVVTPRSQAKTAPGTWGAYRGAPLPGLAFAEGGQSSTGSLLRWARHQLFLGGDDGDDTDNDDGDTPTTAVTYQQLDREAAAVPPGADGLVVLATFQGSRTPVTDARARGAILGLTLSHTRAHLWRALLEGVCFGTRACLEALLVPQEEDDDEESTAATAAGSCSTTAADEIVIAGGVTRSDVWLQLHADVTNKTVVVCENSENAPLLGCAILAAVGSGVHPTVADAVRRMVRTERRIAPNPAAAQQYDAIFQNVYRKVAEAVRPISHAIHDLRGGSSATAPSSEGTEGEVAGDVARAVSPSLLACDWAVMRDEIHSCLDASLRRFHVDVFDGVFLDSPQALTFGPQMVQAIRRSCESYKNNNNNNSDHQNATLDLHMCVDRPARFVSTMAEAIAGVESSFIFQWEATQGLAEAQALARLIVQAGMECGVSINPSTDVNALVPLLESGLVSVVDVLAVEPGFGGQAFQDAVLDKIKTLRKWKNDHNASSLDVMVDGGVNESTAARIWTAGADVLVAGTFLFQNSDGIGQRARMLVKSRK